MNWINAIIYELYHGKPNPVLVIVAYLIFCIIAINYPSVEGG